ncbi:MAG TPA: polysaccharide deacetylase family protein [Firmicutes bacterium]|nr:polysaccharide deacetylase family protein [Candidatus Fermentithermobacillaceae bacterium]
MSRWGASSLLLKLLKSRPLEFVLLVLVSVFTTAFIPARDGGGWARPIPHPEERIVENADTIPVLMYHALSSEAHELHADSGTVVPAEEFQAQVAWLKKQGYTTPKMAEFGKWLAGEKTLPRKSILITFDDGYRSFLEYGFPVLQEHGLSAVVFVIGGRTDSSTAGDRHLSWDDMAAMAESGLVEYQSHTYDGHGGTSEAPEILDWQVAELAEDLQRFKGRFRDHGLPLPKAFAYPFGAMSDWMPAVLQEEGYEFAFTIKHGFVCTGDDPFRLNRITIWPGTSLEQFERCITP